MPTHDKIAKLRSYTSGDNIYLRRASRVAAGAGPHQEGAGVQERYEMYKNTTKCTITLQDIREYYEADSIQDRTVFAKESEAGFGRRSVPPVQGTLGSLHWQFDSWKLNSAFIPTSRQQLLSSHRNRSPMAQLIQATTAPTLPPSKPRLLVTRTDKSVHPYAIVACNLLMTYVVDDLCGCPFNHMNGKGFTIPKRKYYLGDIGYSNFDSLFMSYKEVRYSLKKQAIAACCPRNAKELFNLQHSSLCSVIEQIFGVFKKKFPILKITAEFLLQSQVEIVYALTTLYNFFHVYSVKKEDIFEQVDFA